MTRLEGTLMVSMSGLASRPLHSLVHFVKTQEWDLKTHEETKLAFLQFHLLRTNSPNPNFFQLWYSYQLAVSPDRIIEEVKLRTLTYQFINLNCTLSSPLMPRISEDFYLDCSLYFCWCDLIPKSVSTMAKYYPLIICEREFTDKNQTISTQFRILGIWL